MVQEEGIAERDDGVVLKIDGSILPNKVFCSVVPLDNRKYEEGLPADSRWLAVIADPVGDACNDFGLPSRHRLLVAYHKILARLSVVYLSKETQPVQIYISRKLILAWMNEASEHVIVVKGFGKKLRRR